MKDSTPARSARTDRPAPKAKSGLNAKPFKKGKFTPKANAAPKPQSPMRPKFDDDAQFVSRPKRKSKPASNSKPGAARSFSKPRFDDEAPFVSRPKRTDRPASASRPKPAAARSFSKPHYDDEAPFVPRPKRTDGPASAPRPRPPAGQSFSKPRLDDEAPSYASRPPHNGRPTSSSRAKPRPRPRPDTTQSSSAATQTSSEPKYGFEAQISRKPKFDRKAKYGPKPKSSDNPRPSRRNRVAPAPRPPAEPQPQFAENVFGLFKPDIQMAIASEGYDTPTPIQEECVPYLLEGRDLLGSAQTGTGKTAAFTLPLLERLSKVSQRPRRGTPRALILAPTRELAAQICDSVRTYGKYLDLKPTVVFGGVSQYQQVQALNRGVDILVATPGRLLDLINQGYIHLDAIEVFILDEVDRMLDMGFIPDINRILELVPAERQTLFFSATMAPRMERIANTMVTDPVRVSITPEKPTVDRITQKVLFVGKKNKDALLVSLLNGDGIEKAVIFTQMKHAANRVVEKLLSAGINGTAIHGNKSQAARTKALNGFKQGRYRVLVATDVAARGLDVDDITHVINYDLPVEAETYVHRIGRTARAGADGNAISFCCAEERAYLRDIEILLGTPVPHELEHEFHCAEAFRSTQPAPKRPGAKGKRQGGRPQGEFTRNKRRNFNRSSR